MSRVAGKVALVTGAASDPGLGRAIATTLAREGARVVVTDVDEAGVRQCAEVIRKEGGEALAFHQDVTSEPGWEQVVARTLEAYGRLDVLVNNAGIGGHESDPTMLATFRDKQLKQAAELAETGKITTHLDAIVNATDEAWRKMLAVHLDGTFYCTREALKIMGPQLSGAIVNMGSIMGTAGGAGAAAYCAAKAGILGFTRSAARELVTRNIRVNAIAPGWIETDMTAPLDELKKNIELGTPMGRFGDPDDIAWAAVYLASEEAKFVTGQVLSPNGGWHMSQ